MTEIRHVHLFAGIGGGAAGFNAGHARVGAMQARMRCIGGIDSDPAACRDFERVAGVPAACLDLMDRDQYRHYHGQEPPDDWREATPADIQRAAGGERPHIVFTSPPCKGFSGLLSESRSTGAKYQALNRLTLRGVWLALEAWQDDPPEFFLLENVPRISTRGRSLLDQIEALLRRYGYATAETTHDCGEIGGLAQSRRRFLLVARHQEKVPPFLYEPEKRPLRAVGDVLQDLPLPGTTDDPMHRLPSLQWRTWVRLALVEAGSDWRSLERLRVQDGVLADYGILPEADYYRVVRWEDAAPSVTGGGGPTSGGVAIADPRPGWGARRATYQTGGHYGVVPWTGPSYAVPGKATQDRGPWSVADPRLPEPTDRGVYVIRALDDTWHRPFTTLELAALQGLVTPDEDLDLDGRRDSAWRERIGNAVPPPAAAAIAGVMARTLLLAWSGETFVLDAMSVWVRPLAVAAAVDTGRYREGRA